MVTPGQAGADADAVKGGPDLSRGRGRLAIPRAGEAPWPARGRTRRGNSGDPTPKILDGVQRNWVGLYANDPEGRNDSLGEKRDRASIVIIQAVRGEGVTVAVGGFVRWGRTVFMTVKPCVKIRAGCEDSQDQDECGRRQGCHALQSGVFSG